MLELPNPFAGEGGALRLLEPPDCDREAIVDRVLSGTYAKPFVIEDEGLRSLYFTRAFIQSEMRLADPYALEFAYTRKMMGFLLFLHEPRAVLMLGLGGGSLAKYCHRHLPAARITAVELDPQVIAFRDQFLVPQDDARFRVIEDDAAGYVAQCEEHFDVVMIDAFDRDGVAPSLCTREFYEDVRDLLPRKGLVVANLVGEKAERLAHLEMMRTVFGGNVILLPVADDGNYVAFAFRDPAFEPRWRWIDDQARSMRARYGLDFPKFAGKLERSRKLGYLRREMNQARSR
ncbi:MAG TPA: fused MFS/spermidine synthase [Usitatibacteraceae bacterium]|nr:fused MFS/spermidine synthase [Usitatibacteraceae bacterium]